MAVEERDPLPSDDLDLSPVSNDAMDTAASDRLLAQILAKLHPVVAEGLFLAAVPHSFGINLLRALRDRDDDQEEKLLQRLTQFSFIWPVAWLDGAAQYTMQETERDFLLQRLIQENPDSFKQSHERLQRYYEDNPDPDPFTRVLRQIETLLVLDGPAGIELLIGSVRSYLDEHRLAAVDRLLATADDSRRYVALLRLPWLETLDILIHYIRLRLKQYRGQWATTLEPLLALRYQPGVPARLTPFIVRAYGLALAETGRPVEAIDQLTAALALFREQPDSEADQVFTQLALGDAHVSLATAGRGYRELLPAISDNIWDTLRDWLSFPPLPLMIYLSLRRIRAWHPSFWPALKQQDWIIARLFGDGTQWYQRALQLAIESDSDGYRVQAQEKLAQVYLTMGDADHARPIFEQLLEGEAAMGQYRRASLRVGLGQALLRQGEAQAALVQFETALPVIQSHDAAALAARAQALLGEVLFKLERHEDSCRQFESALRLFQQPGDLVAATEVAERLQQLAAAPEVAAAAREGALATAEQLQERHYQVRFKHPALIGFRRLMAALLVLFIVLVPLQTIRLDTGLALPEIAFRVEVPAFEPNGLNAGAPALTLAPAFPSDIVTTFESDLALLLGTALALFYLFVYTGIGVGLILRMRLTIIQASQAVVQFRQEGLVVEPWPLQRWDEITELVTADVYFLGQFLPEESSLLVASASSQTRIKGTTAWYHSLQERVQSLLPETARHSSIGFHVMFSNMGLLYAVSLLALFLVFLLTAVAPQLLFRDWPGLPYSAADLYPYFYLGLIIPPLWWLVVQPLRIRARIHRSPFALWIGAIGLTLGLLRLGSFGSSWFSLPDIYPDLLILVMLGAAALFVWRAGDDWAVSRHWPRLARPLLLLSAAIIFLGVLWHLSLEVRAYHYLVVGNTERERAIQATDDPAARLAHLEKADHAYRQLIATAPGYLPGYYNLAAVQTQNGLYESAIATYQTAIRQGATASSYAGRAVAYQTWGGALLAAGETEAADEKFNRSLADLGQAIRLRPGEPDYYLWQALAYQALGRFDEALLSYEQLLSLDPANRTALTGRGWLFFQQASESGSEAQYRQALASFEAAASFEATAGSEPGSEILEGIGAVQYQLGEMEAAVAAWEQARALAPANPHLLVSLGTANWRLATAAGDRCADGSATAEEKAAAAEYLRRAGNYFGQATDLQSDADFLYRYQAQIHYLLRLCPGTTYEGELEAAVAAYSKAIALEPQNSFYWQYRGRLEYVLWIRLKNAAVAGDAGDVNDAAAVTQLEAAVADIQQAYTINPADPGTERWHAAILSDAAADFSQRGQKAMAAEDYEAALSYFSRVVAYRPEDATAAFNSGLAALALGNTTAAAAWYEQGIERAEAAGDLVAIQKARQAYNSFVAEHPEINTGTIEAQFEDAAADVGQMAESQASDPALAFQAGLVSLEQDDLDQAAAWINEGLARAAAAGDSRVVETAIADLTDFFTERPDVSLLHFFEELAADLALQADANSVAFESELYWWLQARLAFKLSHWLFEARPTAVDDVETIFQAVLTAIDRAYVLDPVGTRNNSLWHDFYHDSGLGYFYLRRGDDYYDAGDYRLALADYINAVQRISPASQNAMNDATEAALSAGLAALAAGDTNSATNWYREGMQRVERYESRRLVPGAIDRLEALLAGRPELSRVGETILKDLEALR